MQKRRSLTFLLTLYFSIASTAVLLFGGYFVGRLVDAHLMEQDQAVLEGKLELVRNVLSHTRFGGLRCIGRRNRPRWSVCEPEAFGPV